MDYNESLKICEGVFSRSYERTDEFLDRLSVLYKFRKDCSGDQLDFVNNKIDFYESELVRLSDNMEDSENLIRSISSRL